MLWGLTACRPNMSKSGPECEWNSWILIPLWNHGNNKGIKNCKPLEAHTSITAIETKFNVIYCVHRFLRNLLLSLWTSLWCNSWIYCIIEELTYFMKLWTGGTNVIHFSLTNSNTLDILKLVKNIILQICLHLTKIGRHVAYIVNK